MQNEMSELMAATLQTKMLEALSENGVAYLEKMIESVVTEPVEKDPGTSFSYNKIPRIEKMVKDQLEIRLQQALREHLETMAPLIKKRVAEHFTTEKLVAAMTDQIESAISRPYDMSVDVNFIESKD